MKPCKAFVLVLLGLTLGAIMAIAAPPQAQTTTDISYVTAQEFKQEVNRAMGAGTPPGKAKEVACESNKPNSPAFMLAKLMIIEKAIKKMRSTQFYEANKAKMEPLLKDMERQVGILKGITKQKLKQKGKTTAQRLSAWLRWRR